MRMPEFHEDTFESRLGTLLIDAYVADVDPEGTWEFTDADELIPAISVTIDRIDESAIVLSHNTGEKHSTDGNTHRDHFPEALKSMLYEEFGRGPELNGSWTLQFPRRCIPTWSVRIDVESLLEEGAEGERLRHNQ